jgi:hypothetical protein
MASILGTQLVDSSVDKRSAWAAVTRGPEPRKTKNLNCVRSHCQETARGETNRLRTLVCVCQ